MHHCEGDTKEEDIYDVQPTELEMGNEAEAVPEELPKKMKKTKLKGPTLRSHSAAERVEEPDFMPSSDEDTDPGPLDEKEDDGAELLGFVAPIRNKPRAKKMKERIWYNEDRLNPEV